MRLHLSQVVFNLAIFILILNIETVLVWLISQIVSPGGPSGPGRPRGPPVPWGPSGPVEPVKPRGPGGPGKPGGPMGPVHKQITITPFSFTKGNFL